MFSNINEAFEDNPLGQQLKEFEKEQYKQSLINSVNKEQRIYNNYNNDDSNQYQDIYSNDNGYSNDAGYPNSSQSFITAQGDVESFKKGTKISDLRKDNDETSLGSILDDSLFSSEEASMESSFSNDTLISHKTPYSMKDRTHEYYIRNFIKDFGDNNSISLSKSEYNDTYDHIKTCKYCKDEIKLRMNGSGEKISHHIVQSNNNKNLPIANSPLKYPKNEKSITSYLSANNDIKEIVVVVLIGIVIIFVLDLFSKISKTLGKK